MSVFLPFGNVVNLFYPLNEAASYPDSPNFDMVLCVPPPQDGLHRELRLWVKTDADSPEVEINSRRFTVVDKSADGKWLDYGCFSEDPDGIGIPRFGIIRFYGMTIEQAATSCCVLTSQTDIVLAGSVEDAERSLQGICRADAGTSTLSPAHAEVGTSKTFTMTYAAGTQTLKPGTLLRLVFPKAFSMPQSTDRTADGFLSPLDIDAVTLLSIDTSIESHERIDALYRLERELLTGETLAFEYRTSFVYLFPLTWETMERRYWWSHLPVMAPAIAVDQRKVFVPPLERNGHSLKVEAGPVERLFLFLPGRIPSGEDVSLTGLFTDRYRNVPKRSILPTDFELVIDGAETRSLGSGKGYFTHWYRFQMSLPDLKPGVYRVSAINKTDGRTMARSNPLQILDTISTTSPIYWGEIHAHSEQSDGNGDYRNMFVHARECGNLDFAAAADHACYHTDNEWQWMQDVVNSHNVDNEFVTLIGYEWAGQQGHRNVYTWKDRLALFRGMTPGQKTLDTVYDHFDGDEDVVAGPHVGHTKNFYDCHNPRVQRYMEVYSMWGNFEELAFSVLNEGARIGFTGGGDCHEGRCGFSVEDPTGQGVTPHTFAPGLKYRCGLTAALLPGLTRENLLSGLRNRKTYATTGARILLDFTISGISMGKEGVSDGSDGLRMINAQVHACETIETIDIVKNGEIVHSSGEMPEDCTLTWQDASDESGWYVVRVRQTDGHMAWSSPIWIRNE